MYQIIAGIVCVLAMLVFGEKMIVLIALMGLRPLILERKTVQDLTPYWRFYNHIDKISFVITVITLIVLVIYYQMLGSLAFEVGLKLQSLLMVTWPAFFVIQGIVALTCLDQSGIG